MRRGVAPRASLRALLPAACVCLGLLLATTLGTGADEAKASKAKAPAPAFCVGTKPGVCDIVDGGKATAEYAPAHKEDPEEGPANHAVLGAHHDTLQLFVTAKGNAATRATLMGVATDKTIDPKTKTDWGNVGLLEADIKHKATVTFNCKEATEGAHVMFILADRPSGTAVRFAVHKKCEGAQASQDTHKAVGVDVATKQALEGRQIGTADVVRDGSAADGYVLGNKGTLKEVATGEHFTNFYLGLSASAKERGDELELGPISVVAEASAARPVVSGKLAAGGKLAKGNEPAARPLTITYNCRTTGSSPVSVRVPVLSPVKGSITFSFNKKCAVTDADKTQVKRAVRGKASVPGLTVETANTYDPRAIVENGFTLPAFSEQGIEEAAPGLNMIGAGRKSFSFAAFVKPGTEAIAVDGPIVFVEDTEVASARIDEYVSAIGPERTEMRLKFRCFKTGATRVSVSIPLNPPTGEIKFSVVKVCDPDQELIAANRADADAEASSMSTLPLDVALTAKGDAAVVRNGNVQEAFLARQLATAHAPPVGDVLAAVRDPNLKLGEGCMGCLPAGETLGMTAGTVKAALVKCNVTDACTFSEYTAARRAFRSVVSGAYSTATGPAVMAPGTFSLDTFLRSHASSVQIGNAEVVSFDEKVCVPKLVGPGALASTLNNPDGGNKAKRLTVTFNCVGFGGTALVMVTVPVYGQRSGTVSFSVLKQCAAVNATEFGGEEADNPEMANELENVISHAGAGLHVGRSESGDGARDVIDNGLVLPEFLPTSNVENRDAGGYQVPLDQKSLTLYLSSAEGPDAEAISVGVPQVISFNPRIAKTVVSEESDMHKSQASRLKFQLNEPLELTIDFDCIAEGVAVIAVAVPLGPRGGGIHFELSKACAADESFKPFVGPKIKGLAVGTANGEKDVVMDGQTARLWTRYKKAVGPGGRKMIEPATTSVDFFLSHAGGKPLPFGAPVVIAHKPACNPQAEGAAAEGGELSKGGVKLSVRFNCVWEGQTAVTVVLPLPGHTPGHVVWTMTKRCAALASDTKSEVEIPLDEVTLVDSDGDGVVAPKHESWMPWDVDSDYTDYYNQYGYDNAYNNYYAYDYAPWVADWKPDAWLNKTGDEYWWYADGGQYDYDYGDLIDPWAAELDGYEDGVGDALLDEITARGATSLNTLSVGMHADKMDVVQSGIPEPRFKLCEPTPGQPCPTTSLIGKDTVTFFVTSSATEVLRRPQAYAKYPRSVVAEISNADKLDGASVAPGQPIELQLTLQCLKQGVTSPVLVSIPYGPAHVDFAIVRVCGKSVSAATVAIEASTIFVGVGILASMALSFAAGAKLKKMSESGRDLTA